MRKQITSITTLTLGIIFGSANLIYASPVHAEDVVQGTVEMPSNDNTNTDNTNENSNQDEGVMPISADPIDGDTSTSADADNTTGTDGDFQSEITLYDVEPEPEDSADEEASEPPLWPLIVSASAMGITLVVIIILNLINRPKKS